MILPLKNKSQGFTLIELIVVMGIIGLIMGLIMVSLQTSREKARIAKGKQFSQMINHTVGAYAVGIWKFEEIGAGNTLVDNSGYKNYGVTHGATLGTGVIGNCLEFNGVNSYVDIPNSGSMTNEEMTIEAWIYPRDISSLQMIVSKFGANKDYGVGVNNGHIYIWYGQGGDYTNELGTIKAYKWQHIALVLKSWDSYEVYIDGKFVGSRVGTVPQRASSTANVEIGRAGSMGTNYFNGLIDEVKIYSRAFPSALIKEHYARTRKFYLRDID
ncbi:prepilin-type N-terminal cleavage/methylation domain-containing protein [bacterium]|nr:prepilin-type N-terminal cleavage/methylation domain-containing protein [bacterium]